MRAASDLELRYSTGGNKETGDLLSSMFTKSVESLFE